MTQTEEQIGSQLRLEIEEQPQTLARQLSSWKEVGEAAKLIRAANPEWVCIAARGTSDNAARYAQYLFGAHHGLGVALAAPSLITMYGRAPRLGKALTIGISQSGQSPDVVAVLEAAREQGGLTLAITNDPKSPLARTAQLTVPLATGRELAVAATKTYTGQLMALAMLSVALEDSPLRRGELEKVPDVVAAALASSKIGLDAIAGRYKGDQRFLVVGRGFNYSTAFEIALKMKETSYVVAEPYSVADLLHGPVAMIDEGFPVVLVAPSGQDSKDQALLELVEKRRARLIAISDRPEILARGEARIALPTGVPEWVSPLVAVVPGQLFARSLAVAKGHNPDSPRGLSKVTLTH